MSVFTIIFIALGLSFDAFAVSIVSGVSIRDLKIKNAFRIAIFFGLFQAFMPIMGFFLGGKLRSIISDIDHWVVFCILFLVGCKMIYEATRPKRNADKKDPLNIYVLFLLSIATSLDAFSVGITFAFLKIAIIGPVIIIGVITFALSFFGVFLGNKTGHFFERKIEALGGLILIAIGTKILIEHLS